MPKSNFSDPTKRQQAAASRKANAAAVRASDCRSGCGRKATVTAGVGTGLCATCNRKRRAEAKRASQQQQQEAAPRVGKGKVQSEKTKTPPVVVAEVETPPEVESEPVKTKRPPSRVGSIVRRAMNTSISGRHVTD